MQPHLESVLHITDSQPYAIYHASFAPGESPVLLLHWHPEAEFFYLEAGELTFYIEQDEFFLTAGDALFIPPRLLHTAHATSTSGGQLRALVFSTQLVASTSDTVAFCKYVQPVLHDNRHCALHLKHATAEHDSLLKDLTGLFSSVDKKSDTDLLVKGGIQILWHELYHIHPFFHHMNQHTGKSSDFAQEVLSYIHEHYKEDMSLTELAENLHVNKFYLCRIFKQVTGMSPFTYLNRYRIMKSCEYLIHTDKKISEISGLCGFNNVSYFNREFLFYTKTTPSAYRKGLPT